MKESDWTGNPSRALLASSEEDRFTNYLMELLLAPEMLKAFLSGPAELDLREIDINTLLPDTQVTVPGGRADLVVSGPDELLIFEAKVGAWLHGDQLRTYESFLNDWQADHPGGIGKLYLIAPESQLPRLTEEAAAEESEYTWKGISWEEIGHLFSDLANNVDSARLRTHLRDFDDLVSYRLGDMARPFTAEEAVLLSDRLVGLAIMKLEPIIQATVNELQSILNGELKASTSFGVLFSGRWLTYGARKYWFGVWFPAFAYLGDSPLFFQVWEPLPYGIEIPPGLPKPMNHQQLTGDIIPLVIQPNLIPDELGRIYAAQIAALIKEVAKIETGRNLSSN